MDEEIEIEPELSAFPLIEANMVVDDTPIILNNDVENVPSLLSKGVDDYKEEMLKSGLVESDIEYFTRAYKKVEDVKFIKIHCTGCDKHMGSAPNDMDNRYQHPILKVLLCSKCYQFYCSGEFVKGEDGSELYCRWCGEGGLVYCCTKCPFVFCKNCITRNLGRGTARIVENTEYWVCFSCNPWQISRHRATYWAVQKYSEEMIALSKITGDVTLLQVDSNICCQGKKRTEPCEKSRTSIAKKSKVVKVPFDSPILENSLLNNTPSTSKAKKYSNSFTLWQTLPLVNMEPEDEVICTPDIIPIDESPPGSPLLSTPPPLIPYVIQQQSVSKILPQPQQQTLGKGKLVPINIKNLQKSVQNTFQKHVYQPITQIVTNPSNPVNIKMLNNQDGLRIVHHPASKKIVQQTNETNVEASTETENDWFDKAVIECAEVTEYISTKISGLSGVHSRAPKSERLMDELHNTLQTYIHVAIEKMRKIKRNMQINYDKDTNKSEKIVNPFAKTKLRIAGMEDSSSQDTQSASEDDYLPKEDDYSTQDTDSTNTSMKSKRKRSSQTNKSVSRMGTSLPSTKIQRVSVDDDVIFDMDVTNASDEEMESRTASSVCSADVHYQTEEVINIISSDDDSDCEEVVVTNNAGAKDQQIVEENKEENTENVEDKADEEPTQEDKIINNKDEKINKEEVENKLDEVQDKINKEEVESKTDEVQDKTTKEEKTDETNNQEKSVKTCEEDKTKKEEKVNETITKEITVKQDDEILIKGTSNTNETIKNPDIIEELVKNVETKFNIKNISTKDLLNFLSAKVILFNNRKAQKEFAKVAITETNIKKFDLVETINDILNTDQKQITNNGETHNNDFEMEEPCDVEEMLGSGVVLRAKKSFGDEFSRFIDKSSESECRNVQPCDDEEFSENDDISNDVEANNEDANKNDKMSDESDLDEAELFFNKDNESLSLPPDGIGDSIATNNIFATKETENSDLVLDSGILALKQMAENCVNPSVELRQASTECNG